MLRRSQDFQNTYDYVASIAMSPLSMEAHFNGRSNSNRPDAFYVSKRNIRMLDCETNLRRSLAILGTIVQRSTPVAQFIGGASVVPAKLVAKLIFLKLIAVFRERRHSRILRRRPQSITCGAKIWMTAGRGTGPASQTITSFLERKTGLVTAQILFDHHFAQFFQRRLWRPPELFLCL